MGRYTDILGPVLLSIFVNTYLSGLVGFQYAMFQALKYKKSLCIRFTVLSMYVIDVFQIIIAFYMIWIYCVTHYIDPKALGNVVLWIFATIPLCSTLSSFIAHAFMIYRISLFTKTRVLLTVLAVFSLAVSLLGFAVGLYGIARNISMMDVVTDTTTSYRSLLLSWLVARLALDSVMLGTMSCIYLRQGQNFLNHIQLRIVRISLIIIQCGSLTTLFSICTFIVFITSPKTTIYVVFLLPSGRLYSNVVLSTINIKPREDEVCVQPNNILTKDMWAVNRTTQASYAQSISLSQIRTEQEEIIGSQSGDATLILSRPSKHSEKKSDGLLQTSNDDMNIE